MKRKHICILAAFTAITAVTGTFAFQRINAGQPATQTVARNDGPANTGATPSAQEGAKQAAKPGHFSGGEAYFTTKATAKDRDPASWGRGRKPAGESPLTRMAKHILKPVSEQLGAIERENSVVLKQHDGEETSSTVVRITKPTDAQLEQAYTLLTQAVDSAGDDAMLKAEARKVGEKMLKDYLSFPRQYKLVYLNAGDGWHDLLERYTNDEAALEATGTTVKMGNDDVLRGDNKWESQDSWGRARYGHLFATETRTQ